MTRNSGGRGDVSALPLRVVHRAVVCTKYFTFKYSVRGGEECLDGCREFSFRRLPTTHACMNGVFFVIFSSICYCYGMQLLFCHSRE